VTRFLLRLHRGGSAARDAIAAAGFAFG